MLRRKNRKIVLALGGGAARGIVSIGILKVFEKLYGPGNLPFDMIVGTSMGSLIGAAYAAGFTIDQLEEKALKFNWKNLLDPGFHPTGLLKGERLEEMIHEMVGVTSFEKLNIPFALTTTDINSGQEYIHTSGDLIKLIRASCSWSGFFSAVNINGLNLADGGIRNSIPTKAAKKLGSTFIVAVDPGFSISSAPIDNALKALVQSVQIMGEELNTYQSALADVVIKPLLNNVDQFDFDKSAELIRHGEATAVGAVDAMDKKIKIHKNFYFLN
ncbi:MAG: patatin-like phospholipase family protein [Candidatus Omnitrophica bacterium]|nr:patatin-like phospholipase family protein [Candidatus Omnitrophota bacterium]